ncbi:MAG: cytochrome P450 [Pseudomonadota bacterium]
MLEGTTVATMTADIPFLDLADPAFSIRSADVHEAREQSWYARTPYGIAVLRYDEMKTLLMHPALRQGSHRWPDHHGATGVWAAWWKRIMLNREGADHARLRRLATPAFAPNRVADLAPHFSALAHELIDTFEADRRCDFMAAFAEPYATRVICQLIGLRSAEATALTRIAMEMGLALGVTYAADERKIDAAAQELMAYADALIARRRADPKDDFIGALIAANTDKQHLSDEELNDMIVLSIFGGIDTTRNQLGLAMQLFIDHPQSWQQLADNPSLARAAVEEVMRNRPTATWVTREATQTIVFHDLTIPEGTTIHLVSEAAATDPAHFSPGFDITAKRKPHFGFGGGKHFCIGSPIARSDMSQALACLASRLADIEADGAGTWLPDSGNTGPISLPIRFAARKRPIVDKDSPV